MKKQTKKEPKKFNIKENKKLQLIVGLVAVLILLLGATYAYFAITSVNNATPTTVTGTGEELGTPTLTTNTAKLSLNLTAEMMSQDKQMHAYTATPDGVGKEFNLVELVMNGLNLNDETSLANFALENDAAYPLATVTLDKGTALDCTYTYDISASVTKSITDGSDSDVSVLFFDETGNEFNQYTLKELLNGTVTYQGTINFLQPNVPQTIYVASMVQNSSSKQNDLSGNTYTISITPKSGTQGFSCKTSSPITSSSMVEKASTFGLYSSGFEDDEYRFVGATEQDIQYISSEEGINFMKFIIDNWIESGSVSEEDTKKVFNVDTLDYDSIRKSVISELEKLKPFIVNNYVCFGTTNKSECTNNLDKYMYQIIGLFQEESGDGTIDSNTPYHLKLIKTTYLSSEFDRSTSIDTIVNELNSNRFLNNSEYSYMLNNTWLNKIYDWNLVTPEIESGLITLDSNAESIKNFYLRELNRKSKPSNSGSWNYNSKKIGLMYASDFLIENIWLEDKISSMNSMLLEYINNFFGFSPIPLGGYYNSTMSFDYTVMHDMGYMISISGDPLTLSPTFYLKSDVVLIGSGTLNDPYMIKL